MLRHQNIETMIAHEHESGAAFWRLENEDVKPTFG
jgi:hypothetical protein